MPEIGKINDWRWGCPHLVPGNQWLGTGTKRCCVHTLSIRCVTLRGCPHLVLGNQYLGTGTKWCCVHTLSAQYVTDCVHSHSISPCQTPFWNMNWVARTKQWTARNLQKLLHTGTRVHFCARAQDRDLALEHRHRARILTWVCLKKDCVHISAQYHVWTLSKWMNK